MKKKTAFITGANGAIGQGLCRAFKKNGYQVIGSDIEKNSKGNTDIYISIDLKML